MGDKIIITDDDKQKPDPQIVVIAPEKEKPEVEKRVTESTTIVETKDE
jgi:hypothetical protein